MRILLIYIELVIPNSWKSARCLQTLDFTGLNVWKARNLMHIYERAKKLHNLSSEVLKLKSQIVCVHKIYKKSNIFMCCLVILILSTQM